jgi:hypothetical protein
MVGKSPTKNLKLFRWLLPVIYLGALAALIIGNVLGAGHTPTGLQFLIPVISAPCYVIEFLLPPIPNVFLGLTICVTFGIVFLVAIGVIIDLLLTRLRSQKPEQAC